MKIIFSILFVSFLLLYACTLEKSQNIAVSFIECDTKCDASLRGLHVVDENVVWASGSGGTVLLTSNGGETWSVNKVAGAVENDFRSIYAWDEKRAMVFGVAGPVFAYKTNDGGMSWNEVYRDTTKGLFFNTLKFADARNGLAVSDPIDGKFFIIRTEDGGNNWSRVENLPAVAEGEANFAASNTCIDFLPTGEAWMASGGMAARVFYSHNFGESWDVAATPMIRGQASAGIFSVAFTSPKTGVIVGGVYDQPELNSNIASYTFDGGETWKPALTMPKEYRSCVQEIAKGSDSFLFAIGKTGCDYSTDNGMNWKYINDTGFYTFRSVPGRLVGYAAGANGKISKVKFERN